MSFPKTLWINDSWEGSEEGDPDRNFEHGDEVGIYQLVSAGIISSTSIVVVDPLPGVEQSAAKPGEAE